MTPSRNAAPAGPPPGAIVLLACAAGASAMAMRVNDALLPQLAGLFGVPLGTAAQVVSLYALAYGATQLLWGPVGDRVGKYRAVAWAVLACALASAVCALAQDFGQLRAARIVAGALAAAIIPLSIAWLGDTVAYEHRQATLARFLMGQILGLAAGVWLGGVAADHLGWRAPYAVLTGVYAAVGAGLLAGLRRPGLAAAPRPGAPPSLAATLAELGTVVRARWVQVLLGVVFLEGALTFGPLAFVATHLHTRLGLSLSVAGALLMVYGAGGFIYALAARRLVAGLGEAGLARAGALTLGTGLGGVALAPAPWAAVAGSALAGLGFYMLHNTLQVNATQMAPHARGTAVAVFAASFFLGQSAGVTAIGRLVPVIGTGPAIGLGAVGVAGVGLGFAGALNRRRAVPVP